MLNYFDLLELKVEFGLADEVIKQKYLELQSKFHPDKRTGDLTRSALVNQAFVELKDPLRRAKHIFELNGMRINSSKLGPELFKLMERPEESFKQCMELLGHCFRTDDLTGAYKAWCDCQYLARTIQSSRK